MDSKPKLTLNQIKQSPKLGRQARASDFLTQADREKLQLANARGKRGKRQFNDTDAYIAKMIARFGYDFYLKWNAEELDQLWVDKLMKAEDARERANWVPFEGFIRAIIQGGVPTYNPKHPPKIGKQVQKIIKAEIKAARGEE